MKIKATAPGKLIFLGEYAVLEGAPSMVMAVDCFAEVYLETALSNRSAVTAPAIGISNLPFSTDVKGGVVFGEELSDEMLKKLSFFVTALEAVRSSSKDSFDSLPSFTTTLDTSQFFTSENQKLGLGSSAALTVALSSALRKFQDYRFDIEKEHEAIFKTALKIHRKAQDNRGSGIDIAASVFGGVLKYQIVDMELKAPPIYEKLTIPDELYILFIWTGESASTTQFVRRVNELRMDNPHVYDTIIWRMKQISIAGIEAIRKKDVSGFLKTVGLYYNEMKALGKESGVPIVSKTHRQIQDIVVNEGGTYKPSGAGGGDFGIAFCNSKTVREKTANRLTQNGFQIIDLKSVNKGVQLRNL